jgi:hypothetical protein
MTPIQQITESQFATLTRQWKQKRGSHLPDRGTAPEAPLLGPSPVADVIRSGTIHRILELEASLQRIMSIGNKAKQTRDHATAIRRMVGEAHEALGLPPKW